MSYRFLAPILTADRDFYVQQYIKKDHPEKGAIMLCQKSLPDHEECPVNSWPVRGKIYVAHFVFKPLVDENGQALTELFMVTQVDIAGWVPTAAVNAFAWRVPRQTFQLLETAAQNAEKATKVVEKQSKEQ